MDPLIQTADPYSRFTLKEQLGEGYVFPLLYLSSLCCVCLCVFVSLPPVRAAVRVSLSLSLSLSLFSVCFCLCFCVCVSAPRRRQRWVSVPLTAVFCRRRGVERRRNGAETQRQ